MGNSSHLIYVGLFVLLNVVAQIQTASPNGSVPNVAVIGAGMSGIASAKYSLDEGFNVTVYEQSEEYGGVWWYTDKTGKDQYGNHIHSPMYQGLRTNSPYLSMEFSNFHYPSDTMSFPSQPQVYEYIHSYAEHFNVTKHIKLNHLVVRVTPIENGKWEVIVKDLPNNRYDILIYDIVIVAIGQYGTPRFPNIPGINDFKGKVLHSHDYRKPEPFQGESVLIIGGGSSGNDIVSRVSKFANRITFSQHKRPNETKEEREKRQSLLPSNTLLQDDVVRFTETGAEFIDGTHQTFSYIIFTTGYRLSYPFLSVNTGITVDEGCVYPLYKEVINIEHPTMFFVGLNRIGVKLYDLQARFAMKYITGEKKLPSKAEMMEDIRVHDQAHCKARDKNLAKNVIRRLDYDYPKYSKEMSEAAGVEPIPNVIFKILLDNILVISRDPAQLRNYKYTIIDNNTYTKEYIMPKIQYFLKKPEVINGLNKMAIIFA